MKNKKYLFVPFLLAIVISAFFAVSQVETASAQCVDATGAPCTPTVEIPCGQAGGPACPATPVPQATKTPLSVTNPTEDGSTEVSWSGSCANAGPVNDPCLLKLMNACSDAGGDSTVGNADENGTVTVTCALPAMREPNAQLPLVAAPTQTALPDENYLGSCTNNDRNIFDCFEKFTCEDGLLVIKVDLYSGNGTKYDFFCIPDENVPQLDLPLSIPDPQGKVANWTGGCSGGAGLDACLDLMSAGCAEEGGEVSIWYDDDGAGVYCQNQSEASQPASQELPLVMAPETGDTSGEDWDESCSWASCWAYDLTCWSSGGSGYGVEDGAGNIAYHCDMPSGSTAGQNNLKQLALGVIVGVAGTVVTRVLRRPKGVTPVGPAGGGGSGGGGH